MIAHACTLEEGEERNKLIELIAIQMKKNYLAWNKDVVEDKKIFEDLKNYSKGKIDITEGEIKINGQAPNNNRPNNNKQRQGGKKIFKKKQY